MFVLGGKKMPINKKIKKPVQTNLNIALCEEFERIAKKEKRSVASLLAIVIEDYVETYTRKEDRN